MTDVED